MTDNDRATAIAELGFTPRQARFLVIVLRHSGVCLLRQYAAFAGIVHGQKTRAFFAKLINRRYATAYPCRHNRGRLYHLHHFPLYRAIEEPNSAYRRALPAGRVAERLMMLDTVLGSPALDWLTTAAEKVAYFTQPPRAVPVDVLPRVGPSGASSFDNAFPDRLPIGIEADGRALFVYLVLPAVRNDLRGFLRRHLMLLESLPLWTLRLVFPRAIGDASTACHAVVGEEFDTPLHPRTIEDVRWYFEQLRATSDPNSRLGEQRFLRARQAFDRPRFHALYSRWTKAGDHALEPLSSTRISEALATGAGRVESVVLPHSYEHLSPLVDVIGSRAQRATNLETSSVDSEAPRRSPVDLCRAGASAGEEFRRRAKVGGLQAVQRGVDVDEAEPSGLHQNP
jgi:hypothetical protein